MLPAGVSVNDRGTTLTNFRQAPDRNGPLPYWVKYAKLGATAAGQSEVKVLREGTSGQNIVGCINDFGTIVTRLNTLTWVPSDWVYVQGEAETLDPPQSPVTSYRANLIRYILLILTTYPNCRVHIVTLGMHTDDYSGPGLSVKWPLVEAIQREMPSLFPGRVFIADSRAPSQIPMSSDEVHYEVNNNGGYDQAMYRASLNCVA